MKVGRCAIQLELLSMSSLRRWHLKRTEGCEQCEDQERAQRTEGRGGVQEDLNE